MTCSIFVSTENYWESKNVYVTADAMIRELQLEKPQDIAKLIVALGDDEFQVRQTASQKILDQGPGVAQQLIKATESDDPEIADRARQLLRLMGQGKKGALERRLMAIRTLGELRSEKSIASLKKLLGNKEAFVDEYARRAIAKIKGKPLGRTLPTAEQLEEDLWLLPKDCNVVGQLMFREQIPFDIDQALQTIGQSPLPFAPAIDPDIFRIQFYQQLSVVTQSVGNLRLDALTLGVASDIGRNKGFFVAIIRGKFDRDAVKTELAAMGMAITEKDGVEMAVFGRKGVLMLPSNDRLIFVAGPTASRALAAEQLVAAVKTGTGQLAENQKMAQLIKSVDRNSSIWLAASMSKTYKQEFPLFAPLSSIIFEAKQNKGAIDGKLTAKIDGDDESVSIALDRFDAGLQEALDEGGRAIQRTPFLTPLVEMLKTVNRKQSDSQISITAKIADDAAAMSLPLMLMRMRRAF